MPLIHYIRSYPSFPSVIPVHMASSLRVTHPSAMIPSPRRESSHRLACVKHSVSVHPEPGSNSSFNLFIYFTTLILSFLGVCFFFYFHCPFRLAFFLLTRNILPNMKSFVNDFFLFFLFFLSVIILLLILLTLSFKKKLFFLARSSLRLDFLSLFFINYFYISNIFLCYLNNKGLFVYISIHKFMISFHFLLFLFTTLLWCNLYLFRYLIIILLFLY